ncbi:MAG: xylose dehydrogenase (NAD/NADP) [Verrucomicrobiales bacterium]|jgi:xylose dehydrogenase (NAD/NADP)
MSEKLRWGILGTGMIAKKFAGDLPLTKSGVLAAAASRSQKSADAFAAEFGGKAIEGYQQLLDDPEIDAIYISLPNGLHAEWSIAAMEAGKQVLCEKPIACNEAEAATMFEASERTGQVLVEAFMYRTMPAVKAVLKLVHDGEIGDLRLIRTNFTFARPVSLEDARYQVAHAGGALMDVGCYCMNLTRALVGAEPNSAHAVAHLHSSGVDDYAAGTLKFGDDVLTTFTCGMTVQSDPGAFIAGTEGMIEFPAFWLAETGFTLIKNGVRTHHAAPPELPLYASEADAFSSVVRGETAPWISREDTLGNMRVLDQLRAAAGVVTG